MLGKKHPKHGTPFNPVSRTGVLNRGWQPPFSCKNVDFNPTFDSYYFFCSSVLYVLSCLGFSLLVLLLVSWRLWYVDFAEAFQQLPVVLSNAKQSPVLPNPFSVFMITFSMLTPISKKLWCSKTHAQMTLPAWGGSLGNEGLAHWQLQAASASWCLLVNDKVLSHPAAVSALSQRIPARARVTIASWAPFISQIRFLHKWQIFIYVFIFIAVFLLQMSIHEYNWLKDTSMSFRMQILRGL